MSEGRAIYLAAWSVARVTAGRREYNDLVVRAIPTFRRAELEHLCQRHHVRRLSLFGSALREDFGPESDMDVLIEFEPGLTPGLGFASLQRELTALLGREVDLHTSRSLSRYFRDEILQESEVLYERVPQTF